MAAPAFQAAGAGQTSTGAALSVPWPVHNPDDLGLLVVETTGTSSTMTTPTGWTAVAGTPLVDVASVAGSKFYVFYRRATTSTEPDVATGAQTDHQDAMIYTYRSVLNTGSPINVSATATKAVASLTATCPTITTSSADCLIVLIASRPNDSAATNHFANPVNAALTSLGEAAEWGTIDGDGGGFVVSHGTKAVAGVVGTSTMAKGSSTTDCTLSIALLPVATPGAAPTYRAPIRTRRRVLLRPNRRRGPVRPLTQTAAVTVTWIPPIVSRRRPHRPLLRRRGQPQAPLTQTAAVTVSWVPPVVYRRRPHRPLLRRRQQPTTPTLIVVYVPPIETPRRVRAHTRRRNQPTAPPAVVAVVAVSYVPPIPRASRRFYGIRRGLTTPTPPPPAVVAIASYLPTTGQPRRRSVPSRRRQQPQTPLVAVTFVPPIQTRRRGAVGLRKRLQPVTPTQTAITVQTAFLPPIAAAKRRTGTTRRGHLVAVTITQIAAIPQGYIPPIAGARRRVGLKRRRQQPGTPTVTVIFTPTPQQPRRRFQWLRRRSQPSTPIAQTGTVTLEAGTGETFLVGPLVGSALMTTTSSLLIAVATSTASSSPSPATGLTVVVTASRLAGPGTATRLETE